MPPSIITPSNATTLTDVPVINNASATPIMESGTVAMIIKGCHRLSN